MLATLVVYPWDLIDEGVDAALDKLQGEVGVTGLSLWAATAPVTQLRARPLEPRYFQTRGGLCFAPEASRYEATRVKPTAVEWLKGRAVLQRIVEGCRARKLSVRVLVSASRTGRLAARNPEAACRNVYGVASRQSVCLVNPDIQAYLLALLVDLKTQYAPAGITLTDFVRSWSEAAEPGLLTHRPLDAVERTLLGTCLCASCRQAAARAEVDAAAVAKTIRTLLGRTLDSPRPSLPGLEVLVAEHPPLGAYVHWRTQALNDLLQRLVGAARGELLLYRCLDALEQVQHTGLNLSIPAAVVSRLDDPDRIVSTLCAQARRSELHIPVHLLAQFGSDGLVATLARAAEAGFAGVEIDNYGLLSDHALEAVRQALRFAKRSADT